MYEYATKEEILFLLSAQFNESNEPDKSAIGFYNWLVRETGNDKENVEKLKKLIKK